MTVIYRGGLYIAQLKNSNVAFARLCRREAMQAASASLGQKSAMDIAANMIKREVGHVSR